VDVQCRDYRDIEGGGYDAVATVEMGEHVGDAEYPAFAAALHDRLTPGGRVLVQQMSRGRDAPGGGAFIETYIAADMHMRPLGETVALLEGAGLEVRSVTAMREHYVRTIDAWSRTLDDRWSDAVALVGEETARVWRLYLTGSALAFAERRMGVDQILAARPAAVAPASPGGAVTRDSPV
jgi:cyclopropane-fatty-acyl-phospholipid synthase